jgi:hypothetical protein
LEVRQRLEPFAWGFSYKSTFGRLGFMPGNFDKRNILTIILILILVVLAASTSIQTISLGNAHADLAQTRIELTTTQTELTQTKDNLAETQTDLAQIRTSLAATQNDLTDTEAELTQTEKTLATTQTELALTNDNLVQTQNNLAATQTELNTTRTQYDRATTGYGYLLNDPTYTQMLNFLAIDQTDKHTYDEITYNCYNFATDTANNAKKLKIRCGVVYIIYRDSAHAAIAFDTLDRGIFYFEPQSDDEVKLQVGEHYYLSIIPASGYYSVAPEYDDTVLSFSINW